MAFSTWSISDQQVSARGSKLATISAGGERIYIIPTTTPLRMPFGPGNFDKTPAIRQNLDFRATPELWEYFTALNSWARDYLMCHSERIFKKQLTMEEINFWLSSDHNPAGLLRPNVSHEDQSPRERCYLL